MSKKRLVGYALTVLVALWGIVWYPLQCVNAVKPYTASPLAALHYGPLLPLIFVPIVLFLSWLMGRAILPDKDIGYFSLKDRFIQAVWIVAVLWPAADFDSKNQFLRNQQTWNGACTITGVFASSANRMVVKLRCDNGEATEADAAITNLLLRNKSVTCTLNAAGTADCQP
jgi:hypothetical protein